MLTSSQKYYAKSNWLPYPSKHVSLPLRIANQSQTLEATPILAEDLPQLCADDEAMLRQALPHFALGAPKVKVAFVPDVETMGWLHAREEFIGKELAYPYVPAVKGARMTVSDGSRVWCVWTRTIGGTDRLLEILRFVVEGVAPDSAPGSTPLDQERVQAVAACLQSARAQAAVWQMGCVQAWNPSPWVVAGACALEPECEVVERETNNIVSLNWFGPEDPSEVELVANEKFEWC